MRVQNAPKGRAFVFLRGIEHRPPIGHPTAPERGDDVFCHLADLRSRVVPGEYVRATVASRPDDGRSFAVDAEPIVPALYHQVQALRAEVDQLGEEVGRRGTGS